MPSLVSRNHCVGTLPSVATIFGFTMRICCSRVSALARVSSGRGLRLPGGLRLTRFVMYTSSRCRPTLSRIRSRSWPARPTNGRPLRSSSSPGASPTIIRSASSGPSPKTRVSDRSESAGGVCAAWRSSSAKVMPRLYHAPAARLSAQRGPLAAHFAAHLGLEPDHQEEVLERVLPPLHVDVIVRRRAGDERQALVQVERRARDLLGRSVVRDLRELGVHFATRLGVAPERVGVLGLICAEKVLLGDASVVLEAPKDLVGAQHDLDVHARSFRTTAPEA